MARFSIMLKKNLEGEGWTSVVGFRVGKEEGKRRWTGHNSHPSSSSSLLVPFPLYLESFRLRFLLSLSCLTHSASNPRQEILLPSPLSVFQQVDFSDSFHSLRAKKFVQRWSSNEWNNPLNGKSILLLIPSKAAIAWTFNSSLLPWIIKQVHLFHECKYSNLFSPHCLN